MKIDVRLNKQIRMFQVNVRTEDGNASTFLWLDPEEAMHLHGELSTKLAELQKPAAEQKEDALLEEGKNRAKGEDLTS